MWSYHPTVAWPYTKTICMDAELCLIAGSNCSCYMQARLQWLHVIQPRSSEAMEGAANMCTLQRKQNKNQHGPVVGWLCYDLTSMRVGSSAARRGWEKMNAVGCAVQIMMRLVGFPSWPAPGVKA